MDRMYKYSDGDVENHRPIKWPYIYPYAYKAALIIKHLILHVMIQLYRSYGHVDKNK